MMAYDIAVDVLDEHCQMSEGYKALFLKRFCCTVTDELGDEYIRKPKEEETKHVLQIDAASGFLGCIGSIDC